MRQRIGVLGRLVSIFFSGACRIGPLEDKLRFYGAKNSNFMARPRLNKKIVRTSVSLDEQMFNEVALLAAQNDVSVAWLVRKAVAELLQHHREELEPQFPLLTTNPKARRIQNDHR
jgi:hypothetical protein